MDEHGGSAGDSDSDADTSGWAGPQNRPRPDQRESCSTDKVAGLKEVNVWEQPRRNFHWGPVDWDWLNLKEDRKTLFFKHKFKHLCW